MKALKTTHLICALILAQSCLFSALAAEPEDNPLVKEHVCGALPSKDDLLIRNAYVLDYDAAHKAPRWVAYHLTKDYRKTPTRQRKWVSYLNDPDYTGKPKNSDYSNNGQKKLRDYAKGHLAPYFISGGDRDGDGLYADKNNDGDADDEGDDPDDAKTIRQINYHTNLTPQHHKQFNSGRGVWYKIETHIRSLIKRKKELWVFAGPIFGPGTYDKIGPNKDVHVAPMFFQIIIWKNSAGEEEWEAYMMPNHQNAHGHRNDFKVSIRHIEAMTGLDFLGGMTTDVEERISSY